MKKICLALVLLLTSTLAFSMSYKCSLKSFLGGEISYIFNFNNEDNSLRVGKISDIQNLQEGQLIQQKKLYEKILANLKGKLEDNLNLSDSQKNNYLRMINETSDKINKIEKKLINIKEGEYLATATNLIFKDENTLEYLENSHQKLSIFIAEFGVLDTAKRVNDIFSTGNTIDSKIYINVLDQNKAEITLSMVVDSLIINPKLNCIINK